MDNKVTVFLILGILLWDPGYSQQFGRNKVVYDQFDFRVLETPNFRIHHYLEDEEEIMELAQLTEMWYQRHLVIFLDTLETKIPVIP